MVLGREDLDTLAELVEARFAAIPNRNLGPSVAPGPMFSATGRFRNCVRINCAVPWSTEVETALQRLGALAASQLVAQ